MVFQGFLHAGKKLFSPETSLFLFPTAIAIGTLFQNIGLAVFLNLGIKAAWILTNNVVQDRLGHDVFGQFMALYSLGFLFLAFADMGINQYTTKTLASQPDVLKKMFPNLLSLKLTFSLVYPFFMLGVGYVLGYEGNQLFYLGLLCALHGIVQVNAFFRATFQAFQKFRLDAFASILDRAVLLVIVLALLFTRIDLESYIIANLVSVAVAMVILYLLLLRLVGFMGPRWTRAGTFDLLKKSFPFAVITILYSVNDKVDQVMLDRLLEDDGHETGLYAGAYRWVDAIMMYLWTVLPIFFAKFALHVGDQKALDRLLAFGLPIAAVPMMFAGGFALLYGEKFLWLFQNSTPAEIATMTVCLKVLFLSVIVNGFFAIYSTLLTSTNHERFVSRMIFISILINVTLNFIFIPQYGAVASAWTTVISFSFLSISYLYFIQFRLPVHIPYQQFLRLLTVGILFGGAFYGLSLTVLPWYLSTGIAGLVLAALTFAFGLVKFNAGSEELPGPED